MSSEACLASLPLTSLATSIRANCSQFSALRTLQTAPSNPELPRATPSGGRPRTPGYSELLPETPSTPSVLDALQARKGIPKKAYKFVSYIEAPAHSLPSSKLQALLNPHNCAACWQETPLLRSSKVQNSELWLQMAPASALCGELGLPSLERARERKHLYITGVPRPFRHGEAFQRGSADTVAGRGFPLSLLRPVQTTGYLPSLSLEGRRGKATTSSTPTELLTTALRQGVLRWCLVVQSACVLASALRRGARTT